MGSGWGTELWEQTGNEYDCMRRLTRERSLRDLIENRGPRNGFGGETR